MKIHSIWEKADSLCGCLSSERTITSHTRYSTKKDEDPLNVANLFISDEAKLFSSKIFRILDGKTQVFTFPRNLLIRTRKVHSLEVVACSIIITELLGLNTDLVRAASIGHDIGHVPFGHQGEAWMAKAMGRPEFCHEILGPIIAQKIERKGRGLNLSWHTLEAIMCHSGNTARSEMSQEAWVLRYADKISYIFHDVNDILVRMKYPASKELRDLIDFFGKNQRQRTTTAIAGLIIESAECKRVSFEHSEIAKNFKRLRTLMYDVYIHVTEQNVESIMGPVFKFLNMIDIADPFLLLALMTDKDVTNLAEESMPDMQAFNRTTVSEITPHLKKIGKIDLCDPDLDW